MIAPSHIHLGEVRFFERIRDRCKIVFDVGCRTDTHYVESKPLSEFHLFEPNAKFFNELRKNIESNFPNANVRVNNFGLGKHSEIISYYEDAQSFFLRKVHFTSDKNKAIQCRIKKFSEYLTENNVTHIDFLKIDAEGSEPDILFDCPDFLKNGVSFLQFEYASTWLDRTDLFSLTDVYSSFSDAFDFYFLLDTNHPISKQFGADFTSISDNKMLEMIDVFMKNAYGFDIAMVKKGLIL